MRLAFFVSPHGFGHAARSAAVMNAIWRCRPQTSFEIFSAVPEWFFQDSLSCPWRCHSLDCDIGLVQRSALEEDLIATLVRLERWLPFSLPELSRLAQSIRDLRCRAVLCDIAPLGLAVAKAADLPSVLIENFTWDWIYRSYVEVCPGLEAIADYLATFFDGADLRIQTVPHCKRLRSASEVEPVSRMPRASIGSVRRDLGVSDRDRLVLVSMGGIPWNFNGLERVAAAKDVTVVVPGGSTDERRFGSVITLPHRSRFYHPDLMRAADGVVGKLGYSTVAEAWSNNLGMGWVRRPTFPESDKLATWVEKEMAAVEIPEAALNDGAWADHIPAVFAARSESGARPNGADQAAQLILDFLGALSGF